MIKKLQSNIIFYRNECKVTKKNVKKYAPLTNCKKVPITLCAPAGCGFKPVIILVLIRIWW